MSDESGIRVSTTEESAVVRRLDVEVEVARVRKAFDRAYRDLGKQARVKGFRPGRVPRAVLEKMYGASLGDDIERMLVSETLGEAIEESGIQPVSEPTIEAQPPRPDAPFQYAAVLEIKPEIALPELAGLPGRRPKSEVADTDVLTELENLRERNAQLTEEPEDTAAARGHVLKADFVGRIDGKAFEGGTGQDVEIELGADRFIPGFEDQLEGARAGEDREVRVTFPEDYGNAELAGQEAVFAVHVASVQRRELPELDDEFAKDLGDFDDLAALRQRIRDDLQGSRDRAADQELRRSVLGALIERTEFDVPPGLIERRLQRQLARAHEQLQGSVPHEALHQQLESWKESWRADAEREVREALLLEAVAAARGLEASDEELEARIETLAQEQGMDAARLRKLYDENDVLEALRVQVQDEKALALLCEEAAVEEVEAPDPTA